MKNPNKCNSISMFGNYNTNITLSKALLLIYLYVSNAKYFQFHELLKKNPVLFKTFRYK